MKKLLLLLILAVTGMGVNAQCNIEVTLDGTLVYGDEIQWQLLDATSTVVLSGGPYATAPPWSDVQSIVGTPPFTFVIDSIVGPTFCDNAVPITITVGGVVAVDTVHTPCAGVETYAVSIPCPTCDQPTALGATSIGTMSADLSWTPGGSENYWDVEIGSVPFVPTGVPSVGYDDIPSAGFTAAGLTPGTTYEYYVRADCDSTSGTDESVWAGPFSFTTLCAPVATFPACTDFSVAGGVPNCWADNGTDPWLIAGLWPDYGAAVQDNSGFIGVDGSTGFVGPAVLVSGSYDLSAGSWTQPPQLSFDIFSNNIDNPGDNALVTVEISNDGGATWTTLTTYQADNAAVVGITADLSAFAADTVLFRFDVDFSVMTGSTFFNDILINNVCVEETPACPDVDVLSLNAVVSMPDTVDLSWAATASATSYNVEYRVVGSPTWITAPGSPTASTTLQITGLSTDDFEWQVQPICPGPTTGSFVGGTFTTIPFPGTCAEAEVVGPGTTSSQAPSSGGGASNTCFGSGGTNAVWYAYTATVTGSATISSDLVANASNLDTRLSVYTGACGALVCHAQDDDGGALGSGFMSVVSFDICAGTTYYIEWDDRWGVDAQQAFDFSITETAGCVDPGTATITPTVDGFDATTTWTGGTGEICGGGFEWEVVPDGAAAFSGNALPGASGTGFYPVSIPAVTGLMPLTDYDLYVRDVCGAGFSNDVLTNFTTLATCTEPTGLMAVVSMPDTADLSWTPSGVGNTHVVEYRVVGSGTWITAPGSPFAGSTAQITGLAPADYEWRISSICPGPEFSAFDSSGTFSTIPFPGTCAQAVAVGPGTTSAPSPDNGGGAVNNCFASGGTNAVWYAYTATTSGTATVSSDLVGNPASLDTRLSVYTGSCASLTCLAFDDDGGVGINFASIATFSICAGETYFLEWDDRWGVDAQQAFDFTITETAGCAPPANLTGGAATLDGILSVSWTGGGGACPSGNGYQYEIVLQGDAGFAGNDIQSGSGSYPVTPFDITGLNPGTTYEIWVRDDCGGGSFSTEISGFWTTLSPPPVNDSCQNAIPVFGGYTITGFSTVGATGTDITSCTFNDINSVWFVYTANCDDTLEVNTCGSTYDTNISIWDDCLGTTELACNDDAGANGPCTFTLQSYVRFGVDSGETYYIRIAGFNGATGDINFSVVEQTGCGCVNNVWTGANSNDWNDAGNWTCGVVPTSACGALTDNAVIPAGASVTPVVTGTQGVGDIDIAPGSSITINGTLEVCGNVVHDGNPLTGGGDLELMGSSTQTLMGDGAFGFVELNNSNGAMVMGSASLSVDSGLILSSGTFTNNGSFSLNSALGGTAFLDDFTGAGTYSGDLTVNRFVTDGFASGLGQRYFGSAVSGSTASGLDNTYASGYPVNGFILPVPGCLPDSIDPASPYSNLLEWREDATFPTSCVQEGWFALPANATTLTPGRGYSGWMGNGTVVSVTGAPNTGGQSYATTNSGTNTTTSQGYHVLSNPFPSPMNVDAVTLGSGLQSPQYYDATSGPWSGTFQPVLISGTEIPVMQGFTAYSPGSGAFTPDNSYRVASTNGSFAKSNNWYDYRLDIEIAVGGTGDITYLYYSGASTDQFDIAGDCEKRESDAGKPTLYTRNQGKMMSLNGLNLNDLGVSVPMGLISPMSTTATFSFSGMDDFPANTIIYLEDKVEGIFHNLEDGPYTFDADVAENGTDRFEIHFSLPAYFDLIEPTCENAEAIIIENTNDGRTMTISNAGVIEQTTVLDGSENILPAGDYELEVFDAFGASQVYVFVIEEVPTVDANVLASATDIETGESVNFDYLGSGALNYQWFINGQLMAQTAMFSFQFDVPGEYEVELRASNDVCDAVAFETITVAEKSTSIVDLGENGSLNIYTDNDANIVLEFTNVNVGEVHANVFNLLGQEVAQAKVNSTGKQTISNVQWAQGYYIVKVQVGEEVVNQTVFIQK